jgi:chemotaxis protein MotB
MAGILGLGLLASAGCAINFAKRSPWDIQQLAELSDQLEQFKTLAQLKSEEADELRRAKEMLEQRLSSSDVTVGYDERGLVARVLDRVLFDSGKAELRRSAYPVLDKVAQVLKEVPGQPIGIEGHTDNVPIQHSGWANNKALSVARANAVVSYFVEKHGLEPERVTAIGYGETRPIASNDTAADRQKNRRVEIVILPQASKKSYQTHASEALRDTTHYTK